MEKRNHALNTRQAASALWVCLLARYNSHLAAGSGQKRRLTNVQSSSAELPIPTANADMPALRLCAKNGCEHMQEDASTDLLLDQHISGGEQ